MENWKKQLTEDFQDEAEHEDLLRLRQEQAYRSVGALQLRVEELTLEVSKNLENGVEWKNYEKSKMAEKPKMSGMPKMAEN